MTGSVTFTSANGASYSNNLGNGISLNSAVTLNLSDLTITGNSSGGQISNVTNLNFKGTTGTVADIIAASGASLQHTRDPLGAIVVNKARSVQYHQPEPRW